MPFRRVRCLAVAAAVVGASVVALAGPADAHICSTDPLSSEARIYAQPSTSSTDLGAFTKRSTGCSRTVGESYTVCGGGSTYVRVSQDGVSGYTPATCVEIIQW